MSNVKISQLPLTTPTVSDEIPVVQAGVTKRIAAGDLVKFLPINAVTSDPPSPVEGQLWLRTDL